MDITPKYIKMCEKAGEIQTLWHEQLTTGDVVDKGIVIEFETYYDDDTWELKISNVDDSYCNSRDLVWLPRQDQLQETIKAHWNCSSDAIRTQFSLWYQGQTHKNINYALWTDEQLWLAFVMHEKYSKVWDDGKEEWKEEESD